jgi:hypothetical protein
VLSALFFVACSVSPVRADNLFFWAEEVAGNVIFRHQGSIDLTGFPAPLNTGTNATIVPIGGVFVFAGGLDTYNPVLPNTTNTPFGGGQSSLADAATGDNVGISSELLGVPVGYASKTPISGTMTFLSTSLAALGVNPTPFTVKTTVGSNTIHMFTSPTEFAAQLSDLRKKIRKLEKKIKRFKKNGKIKKVRKLKKKVRNVKAQLAALG